MASGIFSNGGLMIYAKKKVSPPLLNLPSLGGGANSKLENTHSALLGPVFSRIVKIDRIPNTEYIRFLRNDRIPNTEYIRFLKMIEYRIPNSTIRMLLFE